jgi:hypothetical protein
MIQSDGYRQKLGENAISILAENLNSGRSYLTTAVSHADLFH